MNRKTNKLSQTVHISGALEVAFVDLTKKEKNTPVGQRPSLHLVHLPTVSSILSDQSQIEATKCIIFFSSAATTKL